MLLRLAFLESERRRDILDGGRLAGARLPQAAADDASRCLGWPQGDIRVAFAWFVGPRASRPDRAQPHIVGTDVKITSNRQLTFLTTPAQEAAAADRAARAYRDCRYSFAPGVTPGWIRLSSA